MDFLFNRTTLQVFVTYLTDAPYVHRLYYHSKRHTFVWRLFSHNDPYYHHPKYLLLFHNDVV